MSEPPWKTFGELDAIIKRLEAEQVKLRERVEELERRLEPDSKTAD